jgi:hypothetical protein
MYYGSLSGNIQKPEHSPMNLGRDEMQKKTVFALWNKFPEEFGKC